ncbi:MAG: hypothetical protein ABIJ96_10110 [Elusimicrobiota bacterium]
MKYTVLIRADEDFDRKVLAQALAASRGVPVIDTLPAAMRCWGIVEEDIERAAAEKLAAELRAAGLEAYAAESGALVKLPAALPVKSLAFTDAGLDAVCEPREKFTILPDEVSLIAAAIIPHTTIRETAQEQKPGMAQKLQKTALNLAVPGLGHVLEAVRPGAQATVRKTGDAGHLLFLDIFVGSPGRRLRFDGNRLQYGFLGDKMVHSTLINFNLFVKGLVRMAVRAKSNKGARIIQSGRPVREMGYASIDDMDRESRCILTGIKQTSSGEP